IGKDADSVPEAEIQLSEAGEEPDGGGVFSSAEQLGYRGEREPSRSRVRIGEHQLSKAEEPLRALGIVPSRPGAQHAAVKEGVGMRDPTLSVQHIPLW